MICTVVSQCVLENTCFWWSLLTSRYGLIYAMGQANSQLERERLSVAVHSFTVCPALHCLILEFTSDSDMMDRRTDQTLIRNMLQIYGSNKVNHNKKLLFGLAVKKPVKISMMDKSKSIKTDTTFSNQCQ